jgi:hypothetical protein
LGTSGPSRQSPANVGRRFRTSHRPVLRLIARSIVATFS